MYKTENEPADIIRTIFTQRREFILIGLTGQIGSGCSSARDILSADLSTFPEVYPSGQNKGFKNNAERDDYTIRRYAEAHWEPFVTIRVRDLLTSFILDNYHEFLEFLEQYNIVSNSDVAASQLDASLQQYCNQRSTERAKKHAVSLCSLEDDLSHERLIYGDALGDYSFDELLRQNGHVWTYNRASDVENLCARDYLFLVKVLPKISAKLAALLERYGREQENIYTQVFQDVGNIVRTYGKFTNTETTEQSPDAVYAIARRINRAIKIHRSANELLDKTHNHRCNLPIQSSEAPLHIVIDSIKNPFEASYLKDRYSAFYLFAISANEDLRRRRCESKRRSNMELLDYREHPSAAKKGLSEYLNSFNNENNNNQTTLEAELINHFDNIFRSSPKISKKVWLNAYREDTYVFSLQDVEGCIQIADVFINNSYAKEDMAKSLLRYAILMMHPGLVEPTPDERCMQIAQMAKLNSGCVSRQVGAVICDSDAHILAVNWNSPSSLPGVECISCSKRNFGNLYKRVDTNAYSTYEFHDSKFRTWLTSKYSQRWAFDEYGEPMDDDLKEKLDGLPMVYCFKDFYNDMQHAKNQLHTRSQHAEERALESCDQRITVGGTLYTTSNSCELCARKAVNFGISRIVYIEPYFGITESHVLGHPQISERVHVELFTGACQRAYIQMYTPVFPLKDELKLRGIEYFTSPSRNSNAKRNNNKAHKRRGGGYRK